MSEIKQIERFELNESQACFVEPCSDGDLVYYSDYAELEKKYEALVTESAALKTENCIQDFIIAAVKDLVRESDGVTGYHRNGDVATWDEVLPELSHSETPTTTQAINKIKAQGVEEQVSRLEGEYGELDDVCVMVFRDLREFAASLRGEHEIKS
ncbi:TPA: hypothetical protein ACGTP8_000249 [Yersinia enterocolitica]